VKKLGAQGLEAAYCAIPSQSFSSPELNKIAKALQLLECNEWSHQALER
jgi:hypothetical protein